MRLLHVITALGVGGAEQMLLKLLGAPALAGFEQRVVALLPGGALAAPMRDAGGAVHELDFMGGPPVLRGAGQLARLVRRHPPDLIQGWLYHGNLGALLARTAARRRVPLVWGVRQSLPSLEGENGFARAAIRLNRWLSSRPECLLFNSRLSIDQHRAFGFDLRRAHYLPNGFDMTRFVPDPDARVRLRAEWRLKPEDVAIGLIARYHPVKDHGGFLRAAQRLVRARPCIRVILAGPGVEPSEPALIAAISELGLASHVRLLGDRRDVPALMSALDIYTSSSRAEAFSNAIGEAMACGLPCVVTSVGDSADLVADTGLTVPAGDPQALAAALTQLIDLGSEGRAEWGRRARARIQAEFSLETVATRYAALYAELADHRA